MYKLIIIILLSIPLSSYGKNINIDIIPGDFVIVSHPDIDIEHIEMGIRCKIYSKFRILGIPASTKQIVSESFKSLATVKKNDRETIITLHTPLNLQFNLNNITSYIHACTFTSNIHANISNENIYEKDLHLGDFLVDKEFHNATPDLKFTLSHRILKKSRYSENLIFQ